MTLQMDYISLDRRFLPIPQNQEATHDNELYSLLISDKSKAWDDLDIEFRCVILAEAGAGKTEEFRNRAGHLAKQNKPSFFIRIEDIAANFYEALEIGEKEQFTEWLNSTGEAWFFLDSVDEARLDNPRTFEKALRHFAKVIKSSAHRAHIYISSRPYAWRQKEDRKLLEEILFFAAQKQTEETEQEDKPQSALSVYTMIPLDRERIRRFGIGRSAKDIDLIMQEIERTNLWSLAERPFDLDGILDKWTDDRKIGGRLDLLRHNINTKLCEKHNIDRSQRQPLNLAHAKEGARCLAAAVLLCGESGIKIPDSTSKKNGIEAELILTDWAPENVRALLERGIFNDIIYGAVRFRHREIRELLAAEWFDSLLKSGNNRRSIESLIFREQYGEKIIAPKLRPILPWLILFDDNIRQKALKIQPEIAIEGGDPSQLPLSERRQILNTIIRRIVANENDRSFQNSSIALIANDDLSDDALRLINEHRDNNDAIFFLGRLVWQGKMTNCTGPLITIALDSSREIYARIAATRAVATSGSCEQKKVLWKKLNSTDGLIPRKLLVELVEETTPDNDSIAELVVSLKKLEPQNRFEITGLKNSLHDLVRRLSIDSDNKPIAMLLNGMYDCLNTIPFVESGICQVSEEFAWLMSPASHLLERLIEIRSHLALEPRSLAIMLMNPALRHWRNAEFDRRDNNLHELVSSWPELNDALYWASIEQAKESESTYYKKPIIDDKCVEWLDHFWNFDVASLPRLIDYMHSRVLLEDRLIALSTAFRVYQNANMPSHILNCLQKAVANDCILKNKLNDLLNPKATEEMLQRNEKNEESQRKRNTKKEQKSLDREIWMASLRANPDRIRNFPNMKVEELPPDLYRLNQEIRQMCSNNNHFGNSNWQALIPDFGEEVALAYRDASIKYWRLYQPTLKSECIERGNSIPFSLISAISGLEIEAIEKNDFPKYLNESEIRHALRYITKEINGFPSWLERMYLIFPELTKEAIVKELIWELQNTVSDAPMHHILDGLLYHAPWIHGALAPVILEWIETNPGRIGINRHSCLQILINSETAPARLSKMAQREITLSNKIKSISWWFALFVDCDPGNGIPQLEQWLEKLDWDSATYAAQIFVTSLVGDRHERAGKSCIGNFRTAEYLKSLYVLMHRYIPAKDDTNRANGGAYTPELRDDAQRARNNLFNLLSKTPGKKTYSALKELVREHPARDYRKWMEKQAYERAEEDGDLEAWTAEQICEFRKKQIFPPESHRQLFDVTVNRLVDLKNWLERGNDSPWETWQRAEDEPEMRKLIAGWLNQNCREQYTTAQEPELANSQRMDIWMQNTKVKSPVPIELKLLDKGWSGQKLCERLKNQLAGDYLREESAKCGVMLLISQRLDSKKRWTVNGRKVGLNELSNAMKSYWESISDNFPGIEAIEVIVIDLSLRKFHS